MSRQGIPSSVIQDAHRFAAEARSLNGQVDVANLLRLADVLASTEGSITWNIEGSMVQGVSGWEPRLRLRASGALNLCCQRCLGGMAWALGLERFFHPVRVGEPIPEEELEDETVDAIEIEAELDVVGLLEDEILLSLPVAPRHDNCEQPRPAGGTVKESPFAALASLRGSPGAK